MAQGEAFLNRNETFDLESIQEEYRLFREYFYGSIYKNYEKFAKKAGQLIKIEETNKKRLAEYSRILHEIHANITLQEIESLAVLSLLGFFLVGILLALFKGLGILLLFLLLGFGTYSWVLYYPKYVYQKIQKKKESQLIFAVMYIAMKMRQNPNLEKAVEHAARHLQPPLKLDFLRLLWKSYTKEIESIIIGLDDYANQWEEKAYYFTIGIRLLISSLYEADPIRREALIDKAVEDTLDSLYERMSEYARELRSPVNGIYMLGVVLPTLVLTLFPIMAIMLGNVFTPGMLFYTFDVFIPLSVYLLVKFYIEGKRSAFSTTEDLYLYLYMKRHKSKINLISVLIGIGVFFGILITLVSSLSSLLKGVQFSGLIAAAILILALGISTAVAFKTYYSYYKDFVDRLDSIDREISAFLFQIGNRLMEGIPMEHAFIQSYRNLKRRSIGGFIAKVVKNIRYFGMSLEEAIFDKEHGALLEYPSSLLQSSMEILIESSKSSQESAGKAALAIARYFIYLEKTKNRMLDLLAEVTTSMKSLAKFIAPLITGLIVGLSAMIIVILYHMGLALANLSLSSTGASDITGMGFGMITADLFNMLSLESMVSPAVIYLIVGIYVIVITIILAYMISVIENGPNALKDKKYIGDYLFSAVILYTIIALFSSIALWQLGEAVMYLVS